MKIRKGDKVKVIAGKDKGKVGLVLATMPTKKRILVEGVNIVSRHIKPDAQNKEGGVIKKEAPINVSNVMYFDSELDRPIRLGSKVVDGKKYRVNKLTGKVLEK